MDVEAEDPREVAVSILARGFMQLFRELGIRTYVARSMLMAMSPEQQMAFIIGFTDSHDASLFEPARDILLEELTGNIRY